MTRLRDDAGVTLIELLIAATITLIVLGATLTAFEALARQRTAVEAQAEVETQARQGIDRLARQLRNLASPGDVVTNIASTQPKSVDRNLPGDLVFKEVGETRPAGSSNSANVRRLRYCLQSSGSVPGASFTASPARQVLWLQTQDWTSLAAPEMPAAGACPGAGWQTQRIVADRIVNGAAEPLFVYSGDRNVITGTTDADREQIARVQARMRVDADATRGPAAAEITTGVILRNQNRAPVARFVYTLLNDVTCSVQLNGSSSEDPESKPLEYGWTIDGAAQPAGVVVQTTVTHGTHTYSLTVKDRAGLAGTYTERHTC
jgi:type II secretory pathway pseudopilin PulG